MNALFAENLVGPSISWMGISPLLVLLGGVCVLLLLGSIAPRWPKGSYCVFTVVVSLATAVAAMLQWRDVTKNGPKMLIADAVALDHFALLATIAIAISIALVSLITDDYLRREDYDGPEVYALYLTAAIGGVVMASSNDLIVLFLGLETLSLSLYLLAASHRKRAESQEAGLKYFVLGGFSSAFFLYGIALTYGSTGSTNLSKIASALSGDSPFSQIDAMLLVGIGLMLVGLAFKVSAVPFHVWTPDVYEGAPSPVTAFMASAGKIASFAALLRVLVVAFPTRIDDWRPAIWVLAVLTLLAGSILAVVQTNVKRMLAFSSISHAGFLLVGVEAAGHVGDKDALAAVLTYLLLYAVLVIGSFAVVTVVAGKGDSHTTLDDFRGLGKRRPAMALALTVFLLAQAGMPATSGFIAKFGVIKAAAEVQSYSIAIIAMLAAVIAAFLYLRIMVSVWLADSTDDTKLAIPTGAGIAITLAAVFTIVVGVYPGWLLDATRMVSNLATIAAQAVDPATQTPAG